MLIGATEIISQTWQIYKTNFRKLVPYMLFLVLPLAIMAVISATSTYLEKYIDSSALMNEIIFASVIGLNIFLFAWIYTAYTIGLGSLIKNNSLPYWKESLSKAMPLLWPLFLAALLAYLIIFAGFLLLIIPGIIFSVWYSFVLYTVIFDNQRGMAALRASKQLVQGRWWGIWFRMFLPSLVIGFCVTVITLVFTIPAMFLPTTELSGVAQDLLSIASNVIFSPLTLIPPVLLYFSAKENPVQPGTPTQPTAPSSL